MRAGRALEAAAPRRPGAARRRRSTRCTESRAAALPGARGRRTAARGVDPWAARDAYVDVVLGLETPQAFSAHLLGDGAPVTARRELETLLEAQRWRLAMFASDGWYWEEPVRPETKQVLRCAARAAQLVDGIAGTRLERRLARGSRPRSSRRPGASTAWRSTAEALAEVGRARPDLPERARPEPARERPTARQGSPTPSRPSDARPLVSARKRTNRRRGRRFVAARVGGREEEEGGCLAERVWWAREAGRMSVGAGERRVRVVGAGARVDAELDGQEVERGEPDQGDQQEEQQFHWSGPRLVALVRSLI